MADIHSETRVASRVERFRKRAAERYSLNEKDIHIGHIALEGMYDDPEMICQIDFTTGQEETNRSVAKRACRLASAMVHAGLKPGDSAILIGNNHMDLCIPYFACHFGGYLMCAIDPSVGQNDLTILFPYIFPKIVFCQKTCEETVKKAFKATNQKGRIVLFDEKESDLEAFIRKYSGTNINYRPALFDHSTTTAWLMLTSGTTGLPKVAVIPFDTLLNGVLNWWKPFPYSCDVILAMATLQWVSSLLYFIAGPLKHSTRVQSSGPLSPVKIVEIINKYRPNTTAFTPFLLGHFMNVADKTCDLSCFKCIIIASCAMEKPLLDRFKTMSDAFLYLAYGMTELLAPIFDFDNDTPFGSTGKPQSQYEFKLMGDDGEPLEGTYKTGELWVKGDAFFKVSEPFTESMITGWVSMSLLPCIPRLPEQSRGDEDHVNRRRLVQNRRHVLQGRARLLLLLIKHYGFLISPLQMEGIIKRHPSVADACVVSLSQLDCMELPVIALIRKNGNNVDPKQVFDLVRQNMEGKQMDAGLFFVDSLPMTPSGKIHRVKVKEMALAAQKAERILF